MEPRQVDNYVLTGVLGSGGMATVYRAQDQRLQRVAAVKVLHEHIASRPENRERFEREARAVAKLSHPNIIQIYGFSSPAAETQYIATELIDGFTLRDVVERGWVNPPEVAVMLMVPIARALVHAHRRGIIHRDMKPENIMIDRQGVPKLMDFGLARITEGDRITHTGAILGSPAHMSPEIIEGGHVDHRADIFGFGTVLYHAMTGQLPFDGKNPAVILNAILACKYPPPERYDARISKEMSAIISRCLARDPENRYQSSDLLLSDLEKILQQIGMDDVETYLGAWSADQIGFKRATCERVQAYLRNRATELVNENRIAAAMACCDRLLAFEPADQFSLELLARLRRRGRRREFMVWAAVILTVAALLGLAVVADRRERAAALTTAVEQARTMAIEVVRAAPTRATIVQGGRQGSAVIVDARGVAELVATTLTPAQEAGSAAGRTAFDLAAALAARDAQSESDALPATTGPPRVIRRPVAAVVPEPGPSEGSAETAAAEEEEIIYTPVEFRIFPPAARVRVDGNPYGQADQLNATGLMMAPGPHEILANLEGLAAAQVRHRFVVTAGRPMTVPLRVPWPAARIYVASSAPGQVFVDGRPVGSTNGVIAVAIEGYESSATLDIRVVRSDQADRPFDEVIRVSAGSETRLVAPF
jgi:serine/threonine-protein kinase